MSLMAHPFFSLTYPLQDNHKESYPSTKKYGEDKDKIKRNKA